jgi:hypothetical protein
MKIKMNTKLSLKDGTEILASTEMSDSSTGATYRIGYTGNSFVRFTEDDILIPYLEKTVIGAGWLDEFESQLDDLELSEELVSSIKSEANIAHNRSGGSPSSIYYHVANDVIASINNGRTPRFENVEWNEDFKIRHAARLKSGLSESELSV